MKAFFLSAIQRNKPRALLLIALLFVLSTTSFAYSPYSTKELEQLEKEFIQQINLSNQIERNPLATEYINHLGKGLAQIGHVRTPYFFIVKSNEINAFAGPGGYIGINTQLILNTVSENELAGVMAHEIAHVRLHHLYRLIEHEKQMRIPMLASLLASAALGILNPTLASGAMMASLTGFAQDNINFIRANEKEADRIGIGMLMQSGFDPRGMASFFKKMQQSTRYYYTAHIPAILRTHPMDDDRIAEAENRTQHYRSSGFNENKNYPFFKELIRVSVANNSKELLDFYRLDCMKKNNQAVCQYGQVLVLMKINQFDAAKLKMTALIKGNEDNIFFQIALAQAEIGTKDYPLGLDRLKTLYTNYPENYATVLSYAQGLLASNEAKQGVNILLKASRLFKKDLIICETLAQAQATTHQIGYAYFTKAECELLQGRKRDAMRQLKQAKLSAKNDPYLTDRITAKMEEIKFLLAD